MGISIRATFKRKFCAGVQLSIRVIITFPVIGWFFKFIDGILNILYFGHICLLSEGDVFDIHYSTEYGLRIRGIAAPPKLIEAKG
jgi:hypothetical protein